MARHRVWRVYPYFAALNRAAALLNANCVMRARAADDIVGVHARGLATLITSKPRAQKGGAA
jgi:hypothetical protein